MDLNVSLDAAARARKGDAATVAAAVAATASISGMNTPVANGDSQQQQSQRKRKANRDSWPFMHAIMLLECFKDVWTKSNMGNLTMAQWTEVSAKVNEFCGISMNEQQCRTKVDNLKKRYKRERMKYAPTGHTSPWEFYGVMNKLFGNTTKLSAAGASPVSGQPTIGDGCGDDTDGSDEEDVVVLDNGGDLIFAASLPSTTSPQGGSPFGRVGGGGGHCLLEGPGDGSGGGGSGGLDASPSDNVVVSQAAEASGYQDGGGGVFSSAAGLSPRLGGAAGKKVARPGKRKRESGIGVGDGYGELLKEVERERNVEWQRRLVELARVDKKRAKLLMRSQDGCVGFRNGPVDAQQDSDEFDDLLDVERRHEDLKCKSLSDAERKVDLVSKALSEAQHERDRLERDITIAREAFEYRKAAGTSLKLSLKKYFVEKIQPADRINASLTKFPYYLSDVTRDFLVEALGSCLDQTRRASHLTGLCASSNTIMLNGPQNSELYQELLVKSIAHDQGVALLMLESTDLAPQDYGDGVDRNDADDTSKITGFRKGDRVIGKRDDRLRGRVVAVSETVAGKIGILFDATEDSLKLTRFEDFRRSSPVEWHYASDFDKDQSGNTMFLASWQAAISALCEISKTAKPLIVYFPDPEQWFQRAVPASWKEEIIDNLQRQLDKVNGNVAFIASLTSAADEPLSSVPSWRRKRPSSIHNLFINVVDIFPPKDESELWRWKALLLQDAERITGNKNIQLLQKVLSSHNLLCLEITEFQICDLLLTYSEAESVIGWAVNYDYSNSQFDKSTAKTTLSAGSLDRALHKLRRLKHCQSFKAVAKDEYEEAVLSTVLPSNSGPKFDDVGALDDAKKILGELVVLPLVRPELFTKGALACPCKGVLLYGPPGTGKTYLAKAVAAQSSANLFWLRGNSIDYKWLEDPKRMTGALFSIARRLAPSIIFVDEVDSIFGIQAGEAMTRLKFEFIYGWERFMSGAEPVLLMAATYRPFDLDESVIQKFPKRLCVDLPDVTSREKILVVLLAKEEIENGFDFKGVAELTDGYSANDLKNLTVAAAYRPVREMLELEKSKRNAFGQSLSQELRALTTQDFVTALEEVNINYNAGYLEQLRQWDRW